MNTPELQRLKMAWLAAHERGDQQAILRLLQENPDEQDELTSFIGAYYATGGDEQIALEAEILPITERALKRSLSRVFEAQAEISTLAELRKSLRLSKVDVARGLRLSVDVWNKFETGAIELLSLQQRQLDRLAHFFQISVDQFGSLLDNSQPALSYNRRQTRDAALHDQQGPQKQSFQEAILRSSMSEEDKDFWS
ncbi:helix-turn-helix domain-containing protein [Tengunoibacter tsumagoiensis]|uniref:HTH cro/C1-type domain-containing protein n=1 Tax=Tengunoibacter tsumagoiensis TaxID=2014871 RepID=A0A401ZV70_9CHLR|nr:helix-turn-helix transcriptional regulator [Tengunoibacter tsumagoiensis]GCE10815.1 hypothetical protein KTT_06740 [Tengunoibacter tsumagoiensis]